MLVTAPSPKFRRESLYPTLLFHSDYRFLGAALAVMFVAFMALTALLWGWWDLERSVSLSPLETAKAFDAPLMKRAGQNSTVEEMIKEGWTREG